MSLARFEEWKERTITYVGGGSISLYNEKVLAKAQETAEAVASSGQSVERLISTAGLILIASRLDFEIFMFFDQRKLKKEQQKDGCKTTDRTCH